MKKGELEETKRRMHDSLMDRMGHNNMMAILKSSNYISKHNHYLK